MKTKKYSKLMHTLMIAICLMLTVSLIPIQGQAGEAHAASKSAKKMTVYDSVIKNGNTVYCSDRFAIYKVNLKTKSVKRLVKKIGYWDEYYYAMKKKGNYIYALYDMQGDCENLYRISINGGGQKKLNKHQMIINKYYIKGKKLYYSGLKMDYDTQVRVVSKLNGSNVKKTKKKFSMKQKETNSDAKGYSTYVDNKHPYANTYLNLPDGSRIHLGKYKNNNPE